MENIYIKVSPKLGEFQVASSLNSNIELQLLQDFIDDPNHIQPFFAYLRHHPEAQIKVIHSPLHQGEDIDWDDILHPKTNQIIHQTCELAQMMATRTHQAIPVIFHFGGQSHKIQETPLLREAYLTEINQLVHQYPDVLFYLENVTIVSVLQQKNKIHFRDASVETVPEFVSWLREALNLPHRFYSVLDTCHTIMVCR